MSGFGPMMQRSAAEIEYPIRMASKPVKLFESDEDFEILASQARNASDLLKALSHETRLLILCLLVEGEKSVSDLENTLTMPQAAVSQQLARLRMEGIVEARREGRSIYYRLSNERVRTIIEVLYDMFCRSVREGRED